MRQCIVVAIAAISVMGLSNNTAWCQDYPHKPLRIMGGSAGGAGDFSARVLAQALTGSLGQPVIVDNRAGVIPTEIVSRASPDGYTLLIDGAAFWIGPLLEKAPYDPVRDFAPVSLLASSPNVVIVHPTLPAKSVQELIALAKAKPGEIDYATSGNGSSSHLAPELFKFMTGVKLVRIPYKGGGPALNDVIAGQVKLMFAAGTSVPPHIKSGRLRGLAVTSAEPSALYPGLPTVAASGVPGYETTSLQGMFVRAGTPAGIIQKLNREVVHVLGRADIKEKFFSAGTETVGGTPEQFAAKMKSEIVKWSKVIKAAGKLD